jgi:simple sugar transport system permease protein
MNATALLIAATLAAGTPLALAGLGLLINERVGILNLGAEGMMLIGALTGFAVAFHTGNDWLGLGAAALASAAAAAAFGLLVIWLNANQYASGLALTLFGRGLTAFVGIPYVGQKLLDRTESSVPYLVDLPFVGKALFSQHPVAYLTMALAVGLGWLLFRTRTGLVLRAVGESPEAAHALGYPVRWLRLLAVAVGGALCGVAGAYLSIIDTPLWVEDMTAGNGWIALALTVFATWRPGRVLLGAYLFGGVTALQLRLQSWEYALPAEFMSMLPYLATVVVLVLISRRPIFIRLNMPASLGKPFFPGS